MIERRDLPTTAATKLAVLHAQADEARAMASLSNAALGEAQRVIATLRSHRPSPERDRDIAAATAEVERLHAQWNERLDHHRTLVQLLAFVGEWLHRLPGGTAFESVPPVTVVIENNDPRAHVERLRSQLLAAVNVLRSTDMAAAPIENAKQQVRDLVDGLARRGVPILRTGRGDLTIPAWSPTALRGPMSQPETLSLIAWLFRDRMIDALDQLVESLPLDPNALPPDERAARMREIEAEIIALQREEEQVITQAAEQGVFIARRIDAMPMCVLNLRLAAATTRQAA